MQSRIICFENFSGVKQYFDDLLPATSAVGLDVVLTNDLGQAETYGIDGSDATYAGSGDLHDEEFDDWAFTRNVSSLVMDSHRHHSIGPLDP